MFFHNYKYRIKCIVREKQMMFWTLLFPIILATLFNMSLANLSNAENFKEINIAVVKSNDINNKNFLEVIKSVSDGKDDDDLFKVEYASKEKAEELLENNHIKGYIDINKEINVVVKKSGIDQSIIKSFVDEYKQTSSTINQVASKNPQALLNLNNDSLLERTNYIKEVGISKNKLDISVNYFYTLIAMACMYGGYLGVNEIIHIQANQSSQGARTSIAPIHKLKLALSAMAAATTVQLFDIAVLIAYLYFVIKVSFASNLGYILLICIIGAITGVSYGAFISAILKKKEGIKVGILIGSTMAMSYLAGMMYDKMKYIVNTNMPIINYLNPVNLIADSFYSLYYYDTVEKLIFNLSILCIFSIIFSVITYVVLRGQKYASL